MIRKRYLILLLAATLTVAGCGDSAAPPSDAGANTQAASTGASAAEPAADTCGGVAEKVQKHIPPANVKTVSAIGQCTLLSIATTLTDDQTDAAKTLCDSAAEVGYSDDTNSITVLGASGKELALGISKAKCRANP